MRLRHVLMDLATGGETSGPGAGGAATATPAAGANPQTQLVQSLVTQVNQQIVAPLQQQIQALDQRITQLSQPRTNASQMFGGGAPAVQTGESALTSRGYQYWRAMGVRAGQLRPENAKVEMQLHQKLHKIYADYGGMQLDSTQSILIPLGSQQLAMDADLPGSSITPELVTEVQQLIAAGILGYDPGRLEFARQMLQRRGYQALSIYDDTGMGGFLGPTQHGELIELIRPYEVMSAVGATQLNLPPNGRLRFDKQTGATTAYWVGEVPSNRNTPTITASEPTTGALDLQAKKLAVLVKLPNELIRFGGPETEAFLRRDMAISAGQEASSSMLQGVANGLRIRGLINHAGIQTHVAGTVGTHGNTFEPKDVALMQSLLEEADYDPDSGNFGWVMRPKMWANLTNRRAAAHTAGTYDGDWLFPINRSDITKGVATRMLNGSKVVASSQVSNARVKGSSTDLSYILAGMWRHYLIGRVGVAEFATTTQGDTPFTTDQTWVRFIQHMDAAPRYENAFVLCDQIDMDLPT